MSELNAKARLLIRSLQFADDPSEAEFDRVHDALESRIRLGVVAAAVGATAATTGSPSAATTATASASSAAAAALTKVGAAAAAATASTAGIGSAFGLKAIVVVALAGATAIGTGAAFVTRRAARPVESVPAVVRLPSESRRPPARQDPAIAHSATFDTAGVPESRTEVNALPAPLASPTPPEVPRPSVMPAAAPVTTATSAAAPVATVTSAAAPVALSPVAISSASVEPGSPPTIAVAPARADARGEPSPTESLDEEITELRAARSSLRDGHPAQALAQLDLSAARFAGGALAEDREAERIFALCALGREGEAHVQALRFLTQHPRSSYAASVRSSCGFAGAKSP